MWKCNVNECHFYAVCVYGGGDDDCNDFSTDSHLLTVLQTFAVALNHCLQLPQQHLVINHDVDGGDDGVRRIYLWVYPPDICHHHHHVAIDDFIFYENHCDGNVEC